MTARPAPASEPPTWTRLAVSGLAELWLAAQVTAMLAPGRELLTHGDHVLLLATPAEAAAVRARFKALRGELEVTLRAFALEHSILPAGAPGTDAEATAEVLALAARAGRAA